MDESFDVKLEKYARVITRVGLNVQPGQRLLIGAPMYEVWGIPIVLTDLVRKITANAYRQGARLVDVFWDDAYLQRIRFEQAEGETLTEYPTWRSEAAVDYSNHGDAVLVFYSADPTLLLDQDPALITVNMGAGVVPMNEFMDLRRKNATNCCLFTAAIPGWCDIVYPHLPQNQRLAALWEAIFDVCRVNTPDLMGSWKEHISRLQTICDYLNAKQFEALHYRSPDTDLRVGLVEGHVWKSAQGTSRSGIDFVANLPTEEVFTLPHRARVNGFVRSTKPLTFGGAQIEDFVLNFEAGRVTRLTAKKGEAYLRREIDRDEGARSLGEVALVPHSSPISQSGLTFHNIIFDENASCHLALGAGLPFNLSGGETLSDEAFMAQGGNVSTLHLDFMMGSGELNVDGQKKGRLEPLMRAGEWVIFDRP